MSWRGWAAFIGTGVVVGLAYRGYWWWAGVVAVCVLVPVGVWVRRAFAEAGRVTRGEPPLGRHRRGEVTGHRR